MQHNLPFLSQYADVGDVQWKHRGCGITALKMVMEYYAPGPSLEELLKTGLALGAYLDGVGWTHRGLVEVAKRYGYDGFNADYAEKSPTPKTVEGAWEALLAELARGPVMASVLPAHIVVVTGFENDTVSLNDPEQQSPTTISLEAFLAKFKRRFVVVRPAMIQ